VLEISRLEVDRALSSIQATLLAERQNGYKNGYPLICINGMESLEMSIEKSGKDKVDHPYVFVTNFRQEKDKGKSESKYDYNVSKFLDFCVYLADNRLAHVVINTTRDYALLVMDKRKLS
jgi:hypothetical protein